MESFRTLFSGTKFSEKMPVEPIRVHGRRMLARNDGRFRLAVLLAALILALLVSIWGSSMQSATAQAAPGEAARSWGDNSQGQLGNGTTTDSTSPTQVSGLTDAKAIAGGYLYSLAVKKDGTAWGWGYNAQGQLGNATTTSSNTPVQVSNLAGVSTIAAGMNHGLALKSDGTVWAWGDGWEGELGNGTSGINGNSNTPVQVSNLAGVTGISAGTSHSLAVKSDGTVWAWGRGEEGQLGNGTVNNQPSNVPVQVSNLTGVVAVAAGANHSLALKSDGTVWAWGGGSQGQLGSGIIGYKNVPVQVSNLTGATAIAAGMNHSLAVKSDGTVWAWGKGDNGQTGNVHCLCNQLTPGQVSGMTGAKDVAGGGYHSMALKKDGTVWAWGLNSNGQLGDATISYSNTVVKVSGLTGVQHVAAGHEHSLAVGDPDNTAPGPVTNLAASAGNGEVSLSWTNPTDADFAATRILSSTSGPATSPNPTSSQTQIYEGTGTTHIDPNLTTGTTYYYTAFAKDASGNWSASATVSVVPPPPNDDFADAKAISGNTVSANGTNVGATRETDEPRHLADDDPYGIGDKSLWYRWTAPASGSAIIDTCQSDFNTVLAVYTGNSLNALNIVAENDDNCASGRGSKVSFNATAGTTYQVAVAGYEDQQFPGFHDLEGTFTLNLSGNAQPEVSSVTPTNQSTGVARNTNVSATFSERMDPATLTNSNVKLYERVRKKIKRHGKVRRVWRWVPVSASVSYDAATKTVTLDPYGATSTSVLAPYRSHLVVVTTGAEDEEGTALAKNYVWTFTTGTS